MKYNFVYKTTNNLNGDYYYGVHSTNNLDDGYMGSGARIKRSINKYGKENFTREIVQFFSSAKCAFSLERAIVTNELIKDPHCLNLAIGGYGGYVTAGYTEEQRKEFCKKMSQSISQLYEERPELRILFSINNPSKRKEVRMKMSKSLKGRSCWLKGKHHSEETRKKMSEHAKTRKGEKNPFYGKTHSDEQKRKWSETRSGKNCVRFGKHWYTNGEQEICCDDKDKPEGWVKGRSKTIKQKISKGTILSYKRKYITSLM